jgi:predicted ester cyclase
MGIPATGKSFNIVTWVIYRIANGKIVEMWGINDGMTLLMQLGALPATTPPAK